MAGFVAEELGIPASTIRYYEKVGLIEPQRRVSSRRSIDERAIFTLKFIQLAQAAGFSLAEARSLLDSYAKDPNPSGMWIVLAGEEGGRAHPDRKPGADGSHPVRTPEMPSATLDECVH